MEVLLQKFSNIIKPFKGILLDAYGVFWGGNDVGLLPGSKETMEHLVLKEKKVGILTNTTQMAPKEIDKLKKHGLHQGIHFHFLMTSGEIARNMFLHEKLPFETPRKKFWLFGSIHPKFSTHEAIFKDSSYIETKNIQEADFIYISIPHINGEDQIDPNVFREGIEKIVNYKLPMVCPNPDRFAHEGNPPIAVVRQGSIASIYEELGGQVLYIGKPSNMAFKAAMKLFLSHQVLVPKDVLMVGDTPETDIKGAKNFGMSSALVMKTGITAEKINAFGQEKVMQEIISNGLPDFFIEGFENHGF